MASDHEATEASSVKVTDPQMLVLAAMIWAGQTWVMTDSEIAQRTRTIDTGRPARASVIDRLNSLTKKGLVEIVDDRPPRRRKVTDLGMAVYERG